MGNPDVCLRVIHSGKFMMGKKIAYVGGKTNVFNPHLDKNLLSFPNIRSYLKDVRYGRVKAVYYLCKKHDEFILINDDNGVMTTVIKDLKDRDTFDVYIDHYNPLLFDNNDNEQVEAGDEAVRKEDEEIFDDQGIYVQNNRVGVSFSELVHESSDAAIEKAYGGLVDVDVDIDSELGEEANEPHTNIDNLLFPVSFLTDDEDDELQEARQKIRDFKNKNSIPNEKVDSEVNNVDDMHANGDVEAEDDELPCSDDSESKHESDYFSSDDGGNYYSGSDEECDNALRRHSSSIKFDPTTTIPIFCLGMIFNNVEQLRHAIAMYALRKTLGVHFVKNERERVRAHCREGYPWALFASNESSEEATLKIKLYIPHHKCRTVKRSGFANAKYLSKIYKPIVQLKQNIKLRELKALVRTDLKLYITTSVAKSTKQKILDEIIGDVGREFALLNCYVNEIRRTNPGSTCLVDVNRHNIESPPIFSRFYVCFDACKKGWKAGCRPIIGLDGCFLKGLCKGQILCAVGRDGNNQMFPIAWAVVSIENKVNWSWFLKLLQYDLNLGNGSGFTLISDMQKGLEVAIEEVLPECEYRMCARHVYVAWAKKWRAEERKMAFWSCAKSTNHPELIVNLDELKKMREGAVDDAIGANSSHPISSWCKTFFRIDPKCDVVDNNLSETFNGWILEARCKSIVTMLDEIRIQVMRRIANKTQECKKWIDDISEKTSNKLEKNNQLSYKWEIEFNGDQGYELTHIEKNSLRHVVHLDKSTCTCREWDLTRIPCKHVVAAILDLKKDPRDFISPWYLKDTYVKSYQFKIQPMRGMDLWETNGVEKILPPLIKKMPGRPKKARRKDKAEEKKTGKLSKHGRIITCTVCKGKGHNAQTCKAGTGPIVPTKSNEKRRMKRLAEQAQQSQSSEKNKGKSKLTQENSRRVDELVNTYATKASKKSRKEQNVTIRQSQIVDRIPLQSDKGNSFQASQAKRSGSGCYVNLKTGVAILNPGTTKAKFLYK